MAGIYIHIPFCKQACSYCDFYFSTSAKNVPEVIESIIKEAQLQHTFFNNCDDKIINTIYFGGGTPSIINPEYIKRIIDSIYSNYKVANTIELTLEVNPDDCNAASIKSWKNSGINRISCGIQSFNDVDLRFMNRSHTANEAENAVKRLQDAGISNISIDLIYGVPNMDTQQWKNNLTKAKELEVTHLSCYGLTVEEKTLLSHWVKKKQVKLDENLSAQHFDYLMNWCEPNGFEQYEISNFCKPGFESKHNSNYWKGVPYLGLGPSAHSYCNTTRWNNSPNMFTYIHALSLNKLNNETEVLSLSAQYHEKIMIGLRLTKGLAIRELEPLFDNSIHAHFNTILNKHIELNHLEMKNNNFALTKKGRMLADFIIEDFFVV